MLALISKEYLESRWCMKELYLAYNAQRHIHILHVLVGIKDLSKKTLKRVEAHWNTADLDTTVWCQYQDMLKELDNGQALLWPKQAFTWFFTWFKNDITKVIREIENIRDENSKVS